MLTSQIVRLPRAKESIRLAKRFGLWAQQYFGNPNKLAGHFFHDEALNAEVDHFGASRSCLFQQFGDRQAKLSDDRSGWPIWTPREIGGNHNGAQANGYAPHALARISHLPESPI